jgi:glycosyltransferase involved in cell wall biosynthesis
MTEASKFAAASLELFDISTRIEGSPMVVKEELACGLLIVSTDVGDVGVRTANVIPSEVVDRSAEDLAAAVLRVIKPPQRSNGRSKIIELSTTTISETVLPLYQTVLSNE